MKPRFRTYTIDVNVTAYNFGQAEIKALEHLKRIEQSLDMPRDRARLYSITLFNVDEKTWMQTFTLKFKVISMYKEDYNQTKNYQYVQKIEKKIEKLYRRTC